MELVSLIHEAISTEVQVTALKDVPMPQHRILVIDHDDDTRLIVRDHLCQIGFDAVGSYRIVLFAPSDADADCV